MENKISLIGAMVFLVACAAEKPVSRPTLLDVSGGSSNTSPAPPAAEQPEAPPAQTGSTPIAAVPKLTLTVTAPEEPVVSNQEASFTLALARESAPGEVTITLMPGCFSATPLTMTGDSAVIAATPTPSCLPGQSHQVQFRAALGATKSALVSLSVPVQAAIALDSSFSRDGYASATQINEHIALVSQTRDAVAQITYALTSKGTVIGFAANGTPVTFSGTESLNVLEANEKAHAVFYSAGELIVVKTVSNTTTRVSYYSTAGTKVAAKEKNYDMIASATEYVLDVQLSGDKLILSGYTGTPGDPHPYASWLTLGAASPTKVLTFSHFGFTAAETGKISSAALRGNRIVFAFDGASSVKLASFSSSSGDADTSFGTNGFANIDPATGAESAGAIIATDTAYYLASTIYVGGPAGATSYITKLDANGNVDNSFGTNGSVSFLAVGSLIGGFAANNYSLLVAMNDYGTSTSKLTALALDSGSPLEGFGDADGFIAITFGQSSTQVNSAIVIGDELLIGGLARINAYSTPALAKVKL
jgi:hypothetical protein